MTARAGVPPLAPKNRGTLAAMRLNDDVLRELEQICERREFSYGEPLTLKGEKRKSMYFILEGWVQIQFLADEHDVSSLRVGDRSPLGEMGFLSGEHAVATATALSPVTVLEVDQACLDRLKASNPEAAAHFTDYLEKTIDRRLRS